jgi:hypothetical protein
MKLSALVLGLFLLAAPAFAADVDGKWSGMIDTPNGAVPVSFTFKSDGAMLTGSQTGMDGMEIPIKDGKVDGKMITFAVSLDFGGMAFELSYKGEVSPSEIKLTAEAFGMPFEFTVKKQ